MEIQKWVLKDGPCFASRRSPVRSRLAPLPEIPAKRRLIADQKTQHTPATLARIWDVSEAEARETAEALYEAGFFERRGHREAPAYWVPFLYRDALNMLLK